MTTIRLLDARRGLNRKCEELFGDAKIAEAIYRYLCDGLEECEDAEPERKKGKWVLIHKGEKGYSYGDFKCSVCDRVNVCYHLTEYCCHCGAEMMKGEDR